MKTCMEHDFTVIFEPASRPKATRLKNSARWREARSVDTWRAFRKTRPTPYRTISVLCLIRLKKPFGGLL